MPPSVIQQHVALALFHVWILWVLASRSTYSRTRLKSDAARIFATAAAFDTLRASPLTRKPAIALANIGTAIALMTPMIPTTMMISISEKPLGRCESATGFTSCLSNRGATPIGCCQTTSAHGFIPLPVTPSVAVCDETGQRITVLSTAVFAIEPGAPASGYRRISRRFAGRTARIPLIPLGHAIGLHLDHTLRMISFAHEGRWFLARRSPRRDRRRDRRRGLARAAVHRIGPRKPHRECHDDDAAAGAAEDGGAAGRRSGLERCRRLQRSPRTRRAISTTSTGAASRLAATPPRRRRRGLRSPMGDRAPGGLEGTSGGAGYAIVLKVLVIRADQWPRGRRKRRGAPPGEARLVSVKTRKAG